MKSALTSKALVLALISGLLSYIQTGTAAAAEYSTTTTFQSGYVYIAFKDSSATCTWTVPSYTVSMDYLLIGGGGEAGYSGSFTSSAITGRRTGGRS